VTAEALPPFEDPRVVLARHGLRPKRRLSQCFLTSRPAVDAMVRAIAPAPQERIVELGAGLGTLTLELMRAGARVLAVERDPDMLAVLRDELCPHGLDLRDQDAASVDYAALAKQAGTRLCVVGNLPYAVTGAILRNLIAHRTALSRVFVMVQREVGERLRAAPGTREYGALTVFTSAAFSVEIAQRLAPGSFHPRPSVQSVVVRLLPRDPPLAYEREAFATVVRAAFQSRRKTLKNALGQNLGPSQAERILALAQIDGRRRGETLSVLELDELAKALEASRGA
jgi:16S rRNA (adenine1518-N6/adenine1519-N6)-dimethyltransferase